MDLWLKAFGSAIQTRSFNALSAVWSMLMILVCFSTQVHARQDFLAAWKKHYPASISSQRECQLCHQSVGGGDGWNAYGYSIRSAFNDIYEGRNIVGAFQEVERFNSDLDPNDLSNIDEINTGLDPGWIVGRHNVIFFKNGTAITNQLSPLTDTDLARPFDSELCFVIKIDNENFSTICL